MKTDKNKPKTLIIKFNQKTHKPKYIGIAEPLENGDYTITDIHGKFESICTIIPDKEE